MKKMHPIEALIEQGEHQQLDFKFEVSDSKKIARTLSAFANTDCHEYRKYPYLGRYRRNLPLIRFRTRL